VLNRTVTIIDHFSLFVRKLGSSASSLLICRVRRYRSDQCPPGSWPADLTDRAQSARIYPWGVYEMTKGRVAADTAAACGCEVHAGRRNAVAVDPEIKSANLKRLRRIEGQVRGLARMVEEDRYCPDIVVQISSVQEALRAVGRALMRNHLRHCASQAIRKGSPAEAEAMYDELMNLIYTLAR
jgi:DNA-binding FrmR family transcriptional regulator